LGNTADRQPQWALTYCHLKSAKKKKKKKKQTLQDFFDRKSLAFAAVYDEVRLFMTGELSWY
jgi:hypothetical protein